MGPGRLDQTLCVLSERRALCHDLVLDLIVTLDRGRNKREEAFGKISDALILRTWLPLVYLPTIKLDFEAVLCAQ